ncbi:protein rep [Lacinutrix neustonica]|uniref:Protein rep n=1 Tax=Lacinutrix neustonica TaxID=2980107 RepID=A0A9E8MVZ9_9FLAO|nr:protein rep [Lacinutrix neustonica]WAC02513.1 protein rep [Lacinutrix neustonica]
MLDEKTQALEAQFVASEVNRLGSEKSTDFSLATYRDFVVRSKVGFRYILYKMRRESQAIMVKSEKEAFVNSGKKPNIEFCGKNIKYQTEAVELVLNDKKLPCFRNLAMCGLVWRCPICSMKILQGRSEQLSDILIEHEKTGNKTGFITLTIPHTKKDTLKETLDKINDNYRRFQQTRWFRNHKKNIIGQVKALEITYTNQNGWHPHLHILYFYKTHNVNQIQSFQKELVSKWVDFRDNNARLVGQDYQLCYNNSIDSYVSKWDIIKEVTAVNVKKSKGFTPFQALKRLVIKDYSNFNQRFFLVERFREYSETTKGKHRLSISPNLFKEYPRG